MALVERAEDRRVEQRRAGRRGPAAPWRPRPAVCSSAVTTVPCGAPAAASSRARGVGRVDAAEVAVREPNRGCGSLLLIAGFMRTSARQCVAASASRAASRPSTSWRSASTATSSPASRTGPLVTGPIETIRAAAGKRSPSASVRLRHGRGGGEGDVVGGLGRLDRLRRRAPRAPSRRGRRRRPRRRARAARRGGRRGPRRRGRPGPACRSTSTLASASTSASATKRSGTTSAAIPCAASARAVPGPIAATVAPASARASRPAAAERLEEQVRPRSGWSGRSGRSRAIAAGRGAHLVALDPRLDPDRRQLDHRRAEARAGSSPARSPGRAPG